MANLKYCSVGSSNGLFSAECGTINVITSFHKTYPHLYVDWINDHIHSKHKKQTKSKITKKSSCQHSQHIVLAYLVHCTNSLKEKCNKKDLQNC